MTLAVVEKPIVVIRWRLREVMARERMTNRALAALIGTHEISVGRLKAQDTMPRIDGETLERLCKALKCTPFDLLEYVPDDDS